MSMAVVQAIAFMGITVSVGIGQQEDHSQVPGIIATVCIWIYFVAFSLGWITTPWLYPAEVNSLSMRTKGAALATAADWLFNYCVVQTTPIGIHHLRWGLYLIYALFNAAFIPMVFYLIVETAGRSLEQIDQWFTQNPGWLVHKANSSSAFLHNNLNDNRRWEQEDEELMKGFEEQDKRG